MYCWQFMKSILVGIGRHKSWSKDLRSSLLDIQRHMIPTGWFPQPKKPIDFLCMNYCTILSVNQRKDYWRDTFVRIWMWSCQQTTLRDKTGHNFCSNLTPSSFWDIFRRKSMSFSLKKYLSHIRLYRLLELCYCLKTSQCNSLCIIWFCCLKSNHQDMTWRIDTLCNQQMNSMTMDIASHKHWRFLRRTLVGKLSIE